MSDSTNEPESSLSHAAKEPKPGLRYQPYRGSWPKPEPLPDFIDMPERIQVRTIFRTPGMTDLPRDVFTKGQIDLDKMPIRGTELYVRHNAVCAMKEQAARGELPAWNAHEQAIGEQMAHVLPSKHFKKMGQLDRWLGETSVDVFRSAMEGIEGITSTEVDALVDAYRATIPMQREKVRSMADYLVASEYHLPHSSSIDKGR